MTEQEDAAAHRYRAIFESAVDFAIIASDTEGRITDWNSGAAHVFGWTAAAMIGDSAARIFTPEDREQGRPAAEMNEALSIGRAGDDRWHMRQDGSRFWASGEMTPLLDNGGRHLGFLKILRDRTQQRLAEEERSASEAFIHGVLAASADCIKVLDLDGKLTFMSEGGQRVMEVSDFNAIRGCPWPDFWQGQGNADARAALDTARAGGTGRFLGGAETMAGTPKYWDVQVTPILDTDGRPDRLLSVSRDITPTRQAETALRESEARWRGLFEQLREGFMIGEVVRGSDGRVVDWRYTDVNAAWEELVGTPRAVAIGRTIREVIPGIEDAWVEELAGVAETGEEARFIRQVGVWERWYEGRAFRIGPDRVAVLFFEVTERRRAEAVLQELNATLEQRVEERTRERDRAWKNSQDLQAVLDTAGIFRAVNAAWTIILGWQPDEVVGRTYLDFIHPDDHPSSEQALATASNAELPTYENRYRHKDGSYRWVSWVAAPEDDLIYANGRHITAEKEAAAALEVMQEQLRQSQKMEAVGQLTGGLAHDFNNLLAGISGSLELLQSRVAQGRVGDLERYLAAAQGASKRAAALTHRLLAFSRRQTLDPKPTDANRLIAGMEELVRRSVGPQIAIEVVTAGGLWATLVDPNQLENALLNLCINARDAMPGGGQLTIETGNKWLDARAAAERDLVAGQYVSVCVSDTGAGMAPDVIQRAFDPFFTTKPIGMGTGLGLSMVYGFARQSGGQARIYSEISQGTMVCLYLPRHHIQAEEVERAADLAEAPRAEQGETVLVVDDEPTVRMLVTEVLGDLGYTAIEAADGPAGLRVLQSNTRIDLLVTDVGLPGGMNGRQLADAARERRPGLRVLFITGFADNAVLSHGHLEPGMHVLTKPFTLEALASRMRELIAGP